MRAWIWAGDMRARRWRCAAAMAASELHALHRASSLATPERPHSLRVGNRSTGFRTRHTQQIVVIAAAQAAGAVRIQGLIRPPRDAQSVSHSVACGPAPR
jgi:hypothetical protein